MTGQQVWRPTRRRLTDALLAALAPVAVCGLALGGLSTWTAYGNAGSPARIAVTEGRVYLPYGDAPDTAAFFRITNDGGSADRLLKVTSRAVDGVGTLSRRSHVRHSVGLRADGGVGRRPGRWQPRHVPVRP